MQAIHTKYITQTGKLGSRIKATCDRGSITISYPHDLHGDEVHREAVRQLVARFIAEDSIRYPASNNPWARPFVTGGLPDGTYAHVFV